jgi:hypothetical protein
MRWLSLVLLAACGRVGFDAHGDASAGDAGIPIRLELPPGGEIDRIAIAPDGAWYAVAVAGTVYRSDDHMIWTPCGQIAATGLVVAGTDVYASGTDVKLSTDRCATWQGTGAPRFSDNVALGPTGDLLALADDGIYGHSSTGWQRVTTPVDGATFDSYSSDPSVQIAATRGAGIIHSTDGVTWTQETAGLATLSIRDVAAASGHDYLITDASSTSSGGVSCSDGTATGWTICYDVGGTAVAVDPKNASHVLAAIYDNLVETTDAFATSAASKRGGAMGDSIVRNLTFQSDLSVVAATDSGVYYAAPGTLTWEARLTGLASWSVLGIARHSTGDLYLATESGVIHGAPCAPYTHSFAGMRDNNEVAAIATAADGSVIAVGRHIWLSTDGGTQWSEAFQLGVPDAYRAYSIAFDGTHAYVGTSTQVYSADPPYTTWTVHSFGSPTHIVLGMHVVGGALWLATDGGLFRTTDQAATFQAVPDVATPLTSIAETADSELVAGDAAGGVWISGGGRQSWQHVGPANHPVHAVANAGGAILALTSNGVYASHDAGQTWTVAPTTTALDTRSVIVDPADGQLVVGTIGHGLVKVAVP